MDYDADGDLDLVTGSYTGQFYLFRRQADGTFAPRELLLDEDGDTLMMPTNLYSITAELVDQDADGDLDLVVGARTGQVQVVTNLGTRAAPVWSKQQRGLQTASGAPIKGSNAHHADWDGDGLADLVVGSEWGEVTWYRNVGKNDAPRYADGQSLLARGNFERGEEGSVPTHPGSRVKVHVTDWNGDGRADLLVGDVTWQQSTLPPLTPEQEGEKAKLEAQSEALLARINKAEGEAKKALEAERYEVRKQLGAYRTTKSHTHGWVWLYLRRGAEAERPK